MGYLEQLEHDLNRILLEPVGVYSHKFIIACKKHTNLRPKALFKPF